MDQNVTGRAGQGLERSASCRSMFHYSVKFKHNNYSLNFRTMPWHSDLVWKNLNNKEALKTVKKFSVMHHIHFDNLEISILCSQHHFWAEALQVTHIAHGTFSKFWNILSAGGPGLTYDGPGQQKKSLPGRAWLGQYLDKASRPILQIKILCHDYTKQLHVPLIYTYESEHIAQLFVQQIPSSQA